MRAWPALVGCAALWLGLLPGSAAASAATDDDVARKYPASAARALETVKKRYRLTMSYTAESQYLSQREWCGWGAPLPPATELVWVCSVDDDEKHELRSYTARSVRPFTIKRSGKQFTFSARLKGTSQQVGGGSGWSSWWIGGEGQSDLTWSSGHSADGPVTGRVYLSGMDPARLITDVSPKKDQSGAQTRVTCSDAGCTTTTEPFSGGFSDRSWLKRVRLRQAFGRAFTVVDRRTTPPPASSGTTTRELWRFRFTPVDRRVRTERWQVEVRGQDRWAWGMYTGLRAGVDVDWAHRTTLVVKNGKLTSAKGEVRIVGVRPFSEPPGAFDVAYKTTTPAAYTLKKAVKRGNRVVLGLWKPNRSEYLVTFSVRAAGPQLLDRLRSIGVADPEGTYRSVLARGAVTDTAAPLVPSSPRLVVRLKPDTFNRKTDEFNEQLPCAASGATEQDCFLSRGGQRITVTRLK